jgi:uncharacterized membrane protein
MAEELRLRDEVPSRIERKVYQEPEQVPESTNHHRPGMINFMLMVMTAVILDVFGLFLNEVPFVGAGIVLLADFIFIPWFYMSGMKFTNKRIIAMGIQTIGEAIPLIGNAPLITVNVIYSYYSS